MAEDDCGVLNLLAADAGPAFGVDLALVADCCADPTGQRRRGKAGPKQK